MKIAKQLAKEKMLNYEKYLLEADLEKSNFIDTFSKYYFKIYFLVNSN
jgi:hypothetical protein